MDTTTTVERRHSPLARLAKVRELGENGGARRIRESSGVKPGEMAHAVDVDITTLYKWEHGQRRPTGERALRWLDELEALARRGLG